MDSQEFQISHFGFTFSAISRDWLLKYNGVPVGIRSLITLIGSHKFAAFLNRAYSSNGRYKRFKTFSGQVVEFIYR